MFAIQPQKTDFAKQLISDTKYEISLLNTAWSTVYPILLPSFNGKPGYNVLGVVRR